MVTTLTQSDADNVAAALMRLPLHVAEDVLFWLGDAHANTGHKRKTAEALIVGALTAHLPPADD